MDQFDRKTKHKFSLPDESQVNKFAYDKVRFTSLPTLFGIDPKPSA